MKIVKILSVALLLAGLRSEAQQFIYTNQPNAAIPDGDPTEYSSTIDVTGVAGWLTNVSVSLTVTGGLTGDFYSYLECDNGGFAVLLNRIGKTSSDANGYQDVGLSITLNDLAAADVHYANNGGSPLTGTWQPDGRTNAPLTVLDTDSRTAMLDSFNNRSPNGTWTLFITDAYSNGEAGRLVEWRLILETIPEPAALSLALLGGGMLLVRRRRRNHSRRR